MTRGVLADRDRLLTYSVGEVYQELSLFMEECSIRHDNLNKITRSSRAKKR